ncbi:MAG: hypothetical protein QM696_14510 [Steroidobacteraceae bacterium]
MKRIELPRPIEDYFAFAELPPGDRGRRFTITFTYFEAERLDRLQWWWQLNAAQERSGGEMALAQARREAVDRFRAHIETWLINSHRRLTGGEPFPFLEQLAEPQAQPEPAEAVDLAVPGDAPWRNSRAVNH